MPRYDDDDGPAMPIVLSLYFSDDVDRYEVVIDRLINYEDNKELVWRQVHWLSLLMIEVAAARRLSCVGT